MTDFDGDGIPDVVITGTGDPAVMAGDAITLVRGLGGGALAGPRLALIPEIPSANNDFTTLAAVDVNGDRIPDLLSLDIGGHLSVLLGSADGVFKTAFEYTFLGAGIPWRAVFDDFNHDGKLDLAVVEDGFTAAMSGAVDILLGNGDGTFQSPSRISVPPGAFALAAGDFNRDGNTDLAVLFSAEPTGDAENLKILIGTGNGTFTATATYPVGPYAHSLAVGDFNGDGTLDVIVADAGTYVNQNRDGNIRFFAGKGDGTFQTPVMMPLTGGPVRGPYSLVAADFNGDGKLDLALTLSDYSNYEGGLMILLGRGDGTFHVPAYYATDAVTVQAADLDGDGILDLMVSGDGVSPGVRYLLGNGDGSFRPPVTFSSEFTLYAAIPLALADFNRDGKIDLAVISQAGVVIHLNETSAPPAIAAVSAASFAPGPVAGGSLATAFGHNFPGNATVTIAEESDTKLAASVLFSSPSQINFVVPAGLDAGPASITIGPQTASVVIAPLAPALFTLNGPGLAAAYITRITAGGAVLNEPIATFANGAYSPVSIDVTSGTAYLILFGTGFRHSSTVRALVNGTSVGVTYAGPQPSFDGLDQVNLLLPASLAGSGCSNVTVTTGPGGLASNAVYVCIR